jgi:hypothetical protein
MSTKLGPSQLAIALGVSRNQIYKYRDAGKITADAHGKFDPDQVAIDLGRNLKAKVGGEARRGDRQPAVEDPPTPEAPAGRYVVVEPEPQPHGGWLKREHSVEVEGDEDPNRPSLAEAQRRKETANARKAELDVLEREGKLVDAADVSKTWERHIDQIKNRFLLACAKFPACCRPIADREFRAALEDLAEYEDPET